MTDRSRHFDFDGLMRLMTVVGFVALTTWVMASSVGVISGYVAVSPPATLRFLLAVLIVVFARRTYWEVREWRWGQLSADERFGFSNPLAENARASELGIRGEGRSSAEEGAAETTAVTTATGSQQPRA